MSILTEISRLQTAKSDIAAAITAKGGTVNSGDGFSDFATDIGTIPTGGGGSPAPVEKDVNFYDYDGTLVAGYTIAEAQALSALPTAPDHSADTIPLTFQEWNYTLAQVNATTGKLNAGATYITTDGKTHMLLTFTAVSGYAPTIYFNKSDTSTLTIQLVDLSDDSVVWSTTNSNSGNQNATISGAYAGHFDLRWEITSGAGVYRFGNGAMSTSSIGGSVQNYRSTLTALYIGGGVTSIGVNAFYSCYSLMHVAVPNNITSIDSGAFNSCSSLIEIIIPDGVTSIGSSAFYNCSSSPQIIIPDGVTSIGDSAFQYGAVLFSVIIPNGVTSIGSSVFGNRTSVIEYDFSRCTSIPTLNNINAFTSIVSICIMKIPSALYATWRTATNWSTYAAYMVAV
jgi:hypothetical protein